MGKMLHHFWTLSWLASKEQKKPFYLRHSRFPKPQHLINVVMLVAAVGAAAQSEPTHNIVPPVIVYGEADS